MPSSSNASRSSNIIRTIIGMIERPDYKRRWAIEAWDASGSESGSDLAAGSDGGIAGRFGAPTTPRMLSSHQFLTDLMRHDDADFYVGRGNLCRPSGRTLEAVVADLVGQGVRAVS